MSSFNSPRTISVKRKRGDVPVDSLTIEQRSGATKRVLTEHGVVFRRIQTSTVPTPPASHGPSSQPPTPRRFHFSRETGDLVLVEKKEEANVNTTSSGTLSLNEWTPGQERPSNKSSLLRKLPRASAAEKKFRSETWNQPNSKYGAAVIQIEPPENLIRKWEQFADEIEHNEEVIEAPGKKPSESKHKPRTPSKRIFDRNPNSYHAPDSDSMDVDMEDYVYDTYVREIVVNDLNSVTIEPQGSVGIIVISDEDEELWEAHAHEESDREFDTDDEDENAENFYGADYPEDEVDFDDEYGLNPYKFNHGSDQEEYDAEDAAWSDEETDDLRCPWRRDFTTRNTIKSIDD